ncbi:MAG: indolepyruvate oxidoreductase subunit beta [Brevinematales bacterium]|jgi:indolepyruvate ferredoxin oxidoreductase beta subunit
METKSIVICGVGGQGIVLASDILSYALFKTGYDVKKNEIHGMSQREGAVSSFLRYGEKVHSPVVSPGQADYLIGFEKLEALRNLSLLRENGYALVNDFEIKPMTVIMGVSKYPEDIAGYFSLRSKHLRFVNALEAVKSLGNPKLVNTFILGVLSNVLSEIKQNTWKAAIGAFVKKGFEDKNFEAFEIGRCIRL